MESYAPSEQVIYTALVVGGERRFANGTGLLSVPLLFDAIVKFLYVAYARQTQALTSLQVVLSFCGERGRGFSDFLNHLK